MLVILSWHISIIADPSVSGFEKMIQRFEVIETGTNACSTWDIDKEHYSFIAW